MVKLFEIHSEFWKQGKRLSTKLKFDLLECGAMGRVLMVTAVIHILLS